jgi:hypothetical protein
MVWSSFRKCRISGPAQKRLMIFTNHRDTKFVSVTRGKEITKPVVGCECKPHMGGADPKDQMLQPYLLE